MKIKLDWCDLGVVADLSKTLSMDAKTAKDLYMDNGTTDAHEVMCEVESAALALFLFLETKVGDR